MNIEFETRAILSGGFSKENKVVLIRQFANFTAENILYALNKKYEDDRNLTGQMYFEIARRRN